MSDNRTLEEAQGGSVHCAVCDLRTASPHESVLLASKLWTATLARDVPGWIMVMLNRHNGDWLWGLSHQEAQELGPLMQRLSAAAKAEADAERIYMMGFGERSQHFHLLLLTRSADTPEHLRGPALLERARDLADPEEALRTGSRMRGRLAAPA